MINHPNTVPLPDTGYCPTDDLDQLCINTIRVLVMDAVQQANSGHPGLPMGAAPKVVQSHYGFTVSRTHPHRLGH